MEPTPAKPIPTATTVDLSRPTPAQLPDQPQPPKRTSQSTVEAPASLQLSRASKPARSVNSYNTAAPRQTQRTPRPTNPNRKRQLLPLRKPTLSASFPTRRSSDLRSTNPSQQSHPLPTRKPTTPVDSLHHCQASPTTSSPVKYNWGAHRGTYTSQAFLPQQLQRNHLGLRQHSYQTSHSHPNAPAGQPWKLQSLHTSAVTPSQPVLSVVPTQLLHGNPNGHQGVPIQASRAIKCHHGSQ